MVALHTGLLVGLRGRGLVADRPFLPGSAGRCWRSLVAAQLLRWWCIATLGSHWNTRIVVIPGAAAGHSGPVPAGSAHPNYLAVVAEGMALPLVHSAWITAAVFTCSIAWLLTVRIRTENEALARCRRPMIDLLVAGAGPAGLATAHVRRAAAGLEVTVLDPRDGPIDKACGEGLMPGAVAALAKLGVPLQGRPFHGIRYLDDRRVGRPPSSGAAPAWACGGRCCSRDGGPGATARGPGAAGNGRRTWSRTSTASGRRPSGPRRATWSRRTVCTHRSAGCWAWTARSPASPRFGVRQHFQVAPVDPAGRGALGRLSEAYVTPVAADEIGIAVVGSGENAIGGPTVAVPAARRTDRRRAPRRAACGVLGRSASRPPPRSPAGCCWSATPPVTSTP